MIVSDGTAFQKRKVNHLVPHRKDYYMFVLVRNGSSRHWIDTTPYTLKKNTLYISSPWQVQVKEQSEPLEGILLSFTEEFLNIDDDNTLRQLPVIQNRFNAHELSLQPQDFSFIEDLLQKMWIEYQKVSEWRNPMLLSYLRVLSIYSSRLYIEQILKSAGTNERKLLNDFKKLINEQFSTLHQVAEYAPLLNKTAGYLNEVVKQQSGKTAIEHIHERILLEAKRKLLHTEFSIKEIAYDLGFEDVAYFTRFFKRLAQQTPAAFRKVIREMYK
ncbi:helix-turn-helix domain-containing protein [Niastella sp. OAS944]|uniref:helix-turn-helix domain-containing protein n=1 Tax=Niastella sp. OAS944 TaxID=2664089 RepID=UPI00347398D5|nr:AraC-like DNA-binding protein [Chitinophagaceae bacterium OAS944]